MFEVVRYPAGAIEIIVRPVGTSAVPALPFMVAGQLIETLDNDTFWIVEARAREWRRSDGSIACMWIYEVTPEHP